MVEIVKIKKCSRRGNDNNFKLEVLTMKAKKGIYHNGVVELIEKPETQETSEVLVIFPEKKKGISKIGGRFKNFNINYDEIEEELKKLSQDSQKHILGETGD